MEYWNDSLYGYQGGQRLMVVLVVQLVDPLRKKLGTSDSGVGVVLNHERSCSISGNCYKRALSEIRSRRDGIVSDCKIS